MMKNILNFKDIMEEFCYIFRDTDDAKDVKEVIGMVDNYFALQEKVQQMSFRLRLKYWACTTAVYFYLQMNKQLGRTVGPFSDSVRETVKEAFHAIIWKYDEH
jgi:hypothetical protein